MFIIFIDLAELFELIGDSLPLFFISVFPKTVGNFEIILFMIGNQAFSPFMIRQLRIVMLQITAQLSHSLFVVHSFLKLINYIKITSYYTQKYLPPRKLNHNWRKVKKKRTNSWRSQNQCGFKPISYKNPQNCKTEKKIYYFGVSIHFRSQNKIHQHKSF